MIALFRTTIFTVVCGAVAAGAYAHHVPGDGGAAGAAPHTGAATHAAHAATPRPTGAAHGVSHDATERALAQGRAEQLSVQACWIRALPAQVPSAGYFTVDNAGKASAKLTGIVVPGYGTAMLHQTQKTGGMAKMAMAHDVDVPAHGKLVFAPGGYHAMLEQPTALVTVGAMLPVAFQFASGAQVNAPCKVQPPSALGPG